MPEAPADVIRHMFERAAGATGSGDQVDVLDAGARAVVFECFDPAVEMHEDPRFPEGGVYRGLDGVRAYLEQFVAYFDECILEAPELTPVDAERVLMEFRLRLRGTGSGAAVEALPGWIYTVRGGKVTRIEAYLDRSEARQAAGLPS